MSPTLDKSNVSDVTKNQMSGKYRSRATVARYYDHQRRMVSSSGEAIPKYPCLGRRGVSCSIRWRYQVAFSGRRGVGEVFRGVSPVHATGESLSMKHPVTCPARRPSERVFAWVSPTGVSRTGLRDPSSPPPPRASSL